MQMPEYVRLDEWEFRERYKPILDETGGYRQLHPIIESERLELALAQAEHRVWTIVDADGFVMISAGWHIVNRLAHIITVRPFEPRKAVDVFDPEELIEWEQQREIESAQ